MAYSTGPHALFATLPAPERASLRSSRKIDFVRKRYVLDDDDAFEAMDDVAQRVVLLIAFNTKRPRFITPQTMSEYRDSITKALAVLTGGPEPVAGNLKVSVTTGSPGTLNTALTYTNLRTNTRTTIER